jgi:hypothetical protein
VSRCKFFARLEERDSAHCFAAIAAVFDSHTRTRMYLCFESCFGSICRSVSKSELGIFHDKIWYNLHIIDMYIILNYSIKRYYLYNLVQIPVFLMACVALPLTTRKWR